MKRRRIPHSLPPLSCWSPHYAGVHQHLQETCPTIITRSQEAPYTGLMYHCSGNARMDEARRAPSRNPAGRAELCVRRWLLPPKVADGELPFKITAADGKTANIDAFLGLPPHDDGFVNRIPLSAGRFFTDDDAAEVIITQSLAKALKLSADNLGEPLTYEGRPYQIVGILDDAQFLQLKDINQRPIIPIKALLQQASGEQDLAAMAAGDEESDTGIFYTDLSALVLLPSGACRQIGGQPYSLSVKLHDNTGIWPVVDELLTITNASKFYLASTDPFYIGESAKRSTSPGVYYIGEGYRTSIGGLAFLLIPLLISSTIILNTMLGSVQNARLKCHHNAAGLNPTHIGMFFWRKRSFTASSARSEAIHRTDDEHLPDQNRLITDINLNFLAERRLRHSLHSRRRLVVDDLSLHGGDARRSASGKRKWSPPPHDGKEMRVVFRSSISPGLSTALTAIWLTISAATPRPPSAI